MSDDGWWTGFGVPGLAGSGCRKESASAEAFTVYQDRLVVAGEFEWAGGEPAVNVAQWDGTTWGSLDCGAENEGLEHVNAATVYDDCLIVGGTHLFGDSEGVNCVARWDGTAWSTLGCGVSSFDGSYASVSAFIEFDGDLIAVGHFDLAGEDTVHNVARWDGEAWHPMGSGFRGTPEPYGGEYIYMDALTIFRGQLIAGGRFNRAGQDSASNLAYWDGTEWHPFGVGANEGVFAFCEYDDKLIAAGSFTEIGGVSASRIASWDGEVWKPLGAGVVYHDDWGGVWDLAEFNSELIACGLFQFAGGDSAASIAAWNGSTWRPLADGLEASAHPSGRALQVFQGRLIVGGSFRTAGSMPCRGVAQWDGEHWLPIPGNTHGLDGRVQVLVQHDDRLIAGGWFRWAGGTNLNYIGQWDGAQWEPLGEGFDSAVLALASYRGDLIAGGWFTTAGGDPAAGIARWDGQAWHPLGTGVEGGVVLALHVHGEDLIVGGTFERAGGHVSPRIARWNGTQWLPFAQGVAGSFGGYIYDLETYHGQLVAAGEFGIAGGQHIRSIALWDGAAWRPLGDGLAPDEYEILFPTTGVQSMAVFDDCLVAAGYFSRADDQPVRNIACWDGVKWHAMGNGIDDEVERVCVYEGRLVAGGTMREDFHSPWDHVAQWDGLGWSGLGSGICTAWSPSILAMAEYDGDLYFGGLFYDAGDRPADYIARWTDTGRVISAGPRRLCIMPNPVREGSVIRYFLPGARNIDLTLHDVTGRMVSRFISTEQGGGWHSLSWVGRDDDGRRLPAGVYFLRADTGQAAATGRVLLVE